RQSDQLSAYYPGGTQMAWRATQPAEGISDVLRAKSGSLTCTAEPAADRPSAQGRYTLNDAWDWVLGGTTFTKESQKPVAMPLGDAVRADVTFDKTPDGDGPFFWAYDKYFNQAYGIVAQGRTLRTKSDARTTTIQYLTEGQENAVLDPGQSLTFSVRLFP